jgi:hypothetical protein
LKGADTWLQLLAELPTLLTSLQYLSIARLFDFDDEIYSKKWNIFPGLVGDSVLPESEELGFQLYMGKHRLVWKVMGVTYSGQEMGKALECIVRAGGVI